MQGPRARAAPLPRLALTACLLGLATRGAAGAEPEPPEPPEPIAPELGLTWQAPAGCPTTADVEARFAQLIGGPSRLPSGKHIDASALVRASSADRWTLELATVLDGAVGRRTLAGESCAAVTSAASLILALMIDPAAAERALLAPSPATATPPPAAPRAPEAIIAAASPPAPRTVHATMRVFGGGVVGLLPAAAPIAGVAAGVRARRLGAELSFASTNEQHVDAAAGAGGDFRLLAFGARACAALGGRVVAWRACAGGELERLSGTGVAPPAKAPSPWIGAGTAGLLLEVPFAERFALSLDLGGALRLYHPTFCAFCDPPQSGGTSVARVGAVNGFAALGLAVNL